AAGAAGEAGAGGGRRAGAGGSASRRPPRRRRRPGTRGAGASETGRSADRDVGLAAQHGLLHLGDRLRHLDAARARLRAVEGRAAAPHALLVVEDVEAHLGGLVARVEDEAVRVVDRRGAEVLAVGPEHRATRGARGAQDALGRVVEALALGDRLDALLLRLAGGDEERLDLAVGGEEQIGRAHV